MLSALILTVLVLPGQILSTGPIVEISNGKIVGRDHGHYMSFESIPYAEAPTGENRFEPPRPWTEKWPGVRDATIPPVVCMQWSGIPTQNRDLLVGEEDCLLVNVFTPNITGADLLPVLVFIHGGGFMWGSSDYYGPDNIMKTGKMVLAKFNYRLGPLGFLSTGDEQIPGNMGLKDQVMALKWIKENIKVFGGNPDQILLTGFSAGGASVQFHLLSELSQGIANAAVSFSGSGLAPCKPTNVVATSRKLAKLLDCPESAQTNSTELKHCIKSENAETIVRSVQRFLKIFYNPFVTFGPTVELKTVEGAFLTDDVETLMRQGKTARIPWLNGYAMQDGAYSAAEFMKKDKNGTEFIEELDSQWDELSPYLLFFHEEPKEEQLKKSQFLRQKYFGDEPISVDTYKSLQQMYTDRIFVEGLEKSVELYANYSKAPVFAYSFDSPAPFGFGNILANRTDYNFGTAHGDDVFLIFNSPIRAKYPYSKEEEIISKNLIEMLERFARTGKPMYAGKEFPSNSPFSSKVQYLQISKEDIS